MSRVLVACLGCKCVVPGTTAAHGCLFSHATPCRAFWCLVLAANVSFPERQQHMPVYFPTPHHVARSGVLSWLQMCRSRNDSCRCLSIFPRHLMSRVLVACLGCKCVVPGTTAAHACLFSHATPCRAFWCLVLAANVSFPERQLQMSVYFPMPHHVARSGGLSWLQMCRSRNDSSTCLSIFPRHTMSRVLVSCLGCKCVVPGTTAADACLFSHATSCRAFWWLVLAANVSFPERQQHMPVYFPTPHHVARSGGLSWLQMCRSRNDSCRCLSIFPRHLMSRVLVACLGCKCVVPGTTAAHACLFSHATPCRAFWCLVLAANVSFPERQLQMSVYFPMPHHVARSGGLSWLQMCRSRNDSSTCLSIFPRHTMSRVLVSCLGCKCVVPGTTAADACLFSHATSCRAFWWLVLAANVSFPERQQHMPVYFPTPHHVARSGGLSWLQMCRSRNDSCRCLSIFPRHLMSRVLVACLGCKCVVPGTTAAHACLFSHATPCRAFWCLVLAANVSFPERQLQMSVYFPMPHHVARSGGLSWLQMCRSRNDSSTCLSIFPRHTMSRVLVSCLGCKCVVPGTTAADACLFSHATSCRAFWWLVLAANVSFPERQQHMPVYFPTPHHVARSGGLSWLQMCRSRNDSCRCLSIFPRHLMSRVLVACLGCKCVVPGTTAAHACLFSHATPCRAFWCLVLAANVSFPERQLQMSVYFPMPHHVARSGGLSWLQMCRSRNDSSTCLSIFPRHTMSRVLVSCLGCKCVVPGTTAADACLFSHATSCRAFWWLVLAANVSFPERQQHMPVYFPTPHHVARSGVLSWLQMCRSRNDSCRCLSIFPRHLMSRVLVACLGCKCVVPGTTAAHACLFSHATPCRAFWCLVLAANVSFPERQLQMSVYFPMPHHVARSGGLSWLQMCRSRNDSSTCLSIFPRHTMSRVLVSCLGCKCVVPGTTAADECLFSHATSCRAFWWLVLAANVSFPERQQHMAVYFPTPHHVARSGVLSWLQMCRSRNDSSTWLSIFPRHTMSRVLVSCLGCKCVVPGTTAAHACLFSHATSCRAFWWLVLAANLSFPERQQQMPVYFPTPPHVARSGGLSWLQICRSRNDSSRCLSIFPRHLMS